MAYIEITAKVEEVNESSYTRQDTGEVVTKVQLSLVVPTMRERVLCELPLDAAPKTDLLERWEMEESWVTVSADGFRAIGFTRSNPKANEKAAGALVVFQAAAVREATAE
jgi:hypothetical protein